MLDKQEAIESIDSFLGEKEIEVLKTLTPDILRMFMSKKIRLDTSYYIRGTRKLLTQFKAFYLASCLKGVVRPKYSLQMITERASLLCNGSTDDIVVDEVLFLYAHKNDIDLGNSETWLAKTIVNDVANRNRKGYVTIILSERDLEGIKASGELKFIRLTGSKKVRNTDGTSISRDSAKFN